MEIRAYKVTCEKAYMMSEQGEGYSLTPWGRNTDRYEGSSEPCTVELLAGATVRELAYGGEAVFPTGSDLGMSLNDAVAIGLAREV